MGIHRRLHVQHGLPKNPEGNVETGGQRESNEHQMLEELFVKQQVSCQHGGGGQERSHKHPRCPSFPNSNSGLLTMHWIQQSHHCTKQPIGMHKYDNVSPMCPLLHCTSGGAQCGVVVVVHHDVFPNFSLGR